MPTARRTVRRRRNPSSFVGERIRDAIRFMREEAHDLRKKADDIEDAWGQHDYAYLRDVGVITQSQYADIMAEAAPHTNPRRNGGSDHTASPLHDVLVMHGWNYTHSTPIHIGGGVRVRHSYAHPSDPLGKKFPRVGFDTAGWSGGMGGSGRMTSGRSAADLAKYLKGAASRAMKKNRR
jgi:hypothetical protein